MTLFIASRPPTEVYNNLMHLRFLKEGTVCDNDAPMEPPSVASALRTIGKPFNLERPRSRDVLWPALWPFDFQKHFQLSGLSQKNNAKHSHSSISSNQRLNSNLSFSRSTAFLLPELLVGSIKLGLTYVMAEASHKLNNCLCRKRCKHAAGCKHVTGCKHA